jgi:hypothetical protein
VRFCTLTNVELLIRARYQASNLREGRIARGAAITERKFGLSTPTGNHTRRPIEGVTHAR